MIRSAINWYIDQVELLKNNIFKSKITSDEFIEEIKKARAQAKDMFYDQIYQAFEQGRISGYDEAVAELVKGETFFGLKDGEDYIKENYG